MNRKLYPTTKVGCVAEHEESREVWEEYEEYDKALVYSKLNEFITDTSTIYDVFRFVVSFKGYCNFFRFV